MSNEYFIPKPVIFFTEADAINHINASQMSTSKTSGNQWVVYLIIGATVVGVIYYAIYLSQQSATYLYYQKLKK